MEEKVIFEKVIPNIKGIPVKINSGNQSISRNKGTLISKLHLHTDIELLHLTEGRLGMKLADGSEYVCTAGDVICINSNVAHSTFAYDDSPIRYNLMQFKSDIFKKKATDNSDDFLSILSQQAGMPIYITRDDEMRQLCDNAFRWAEEKETARTLFVASGIYGILAVLYERHFINDSLSHIDEKKLKKLMPVLEHITSRYNEDISLSDAAKVLNMSNFYFCRLFKETLGMGYTDFVNLFRIYKSQSQLIESEKSILDIAFENGFSSVSYFNRVFKSINNCSPSEYRRFSKESIKNSKF